MHIWIIQDGEPIPGIDENTRDWRAATLAKELVKQGHEVLWWASTFDHARKRHRFTDPCTIELQPGLQVRLLHGPGYRNNRSPMRFWHHRLLAAAFAREASTQVQPDLIFCSVPTLELAEQAVNYGSQRRLPVFVDTRDAWPDLYLRLFPLPVRRLARHFIKFEFQRAKRIYCSATGIIAISKTYLDWALQFANRAERNTDGVFPLGCLSAPSNLLGEIDQETQELAQRLQVQTDGLIVTFIGTFGASYDLETVIRAAQHISNFYPRLNFMIILAGEGDQGRKLRLMAKGNNFIKFTGWLDQSDISRLLHLSSVGLASYFNDALQSLPNKPFEYMASGLPLLSSLHGELEQLISDHQIGLQYEAGKIESLVQKIVWLAEHPEERQSMGRQARLLFAKQFSAEVIYPRLVRHLELMVNLHN